MSESPLCIKIIPLICVCDRWLHHLQPYPLSSFFFLVLDWKVYARDWGFLKLTIICNFFKRQFSASCMVIYFTRSSVTWELLWLQFRWFWFCLVSNVSIWFPTSVLICASIVWVESVHPGQIVQGRGLGNSWGRCGRGQGEWPCK